MLSSQRKSANVENRISVLYKIQEDENVFNSMSKSSCAANVDPALAVMKDFADSIPWCSLSAQSIVFERDITADLDMSHF